MICIHCEIEFDPKHWSIRRLLAECGDCSGRDVRKSIGVLIVDGKTVQQKKEVSNNEQKNV